VFPVAGHDESCSVIGGDQDNDEAILKDRNVAPLASIEIHAQPYPPTMSADEFVNRGAASWLIVFLKRLEPIRIDLVFHSKLRCIFVSQIPEFLGRHVSVELASIVAASQPNLLLPGNEPGSSLGNLLDNA
jgi:hypothetical protein